MSLVHKILHATDFSDGSDHALDYAIELARVLSTPLLIAHVWAPPVILTPDGYASLPFDAVAAQAELEAGLDRRADRARDEGVASVATTLGGGDAWREILRIADEAGCDLIVMGTHGRGGVAHLLLGSIAEKVMRKAACPVLTVGKRVPA
jgi:nucleotide-binding universal stress UspA family protein